MSKPQIDTEYQDTLICPHCGCEDTDPLESTGDEECGNIECGNCFNYYQYTRDIDITYSTSKISLREIKQEERESEKRKASVIQNLKNL